jgi:polyhydroxyalkanoate synthase
VNPKLPAAHEQWFADATETPGSWWPVWSKWLSAYGGRQVAAPRSYGNARHRVIEPAPGRYVRQKA